MQVTTEFNQRLAVAIDTEMARLLPAARPAADRDAEGGAARGRGEDEVTYCAWPGEAESDRAAHDKPKKVDYAILKDHVKYGSFAEPVHDEFTGEPLPASLVQSARKEECAFLESWEEVPVSES